MFGGKDVLFGTLLKFFVLLCVHATDGKYTAQEMNLILLCHKIEQIIV